MKCTIFIIYVIWNVLYKIYETGLPLGFNINLKFSAFNTCILNKKYHQTRYFFYDICILHFFLWQALKALALVRSGKSNDAFPLLDDVKTKAEKLDDSTLQAMTMCYKESFQRETHSSILFWFLWLKKVIGFNGSSLIAIFVNRRLTKFYFTILLNFESSILNKLFQYSWRSCINLWISCTTN